MCMFNGKDGINLQNAYESIMHDLLLVMLVAL